MRNSVIKSIVLALAVVSLVACKKKEESTVIIAKKPVATQPKETQRVGDYEQSLDIDWGGVPYVVYTNRHADETLPLADDGSGNKYFDNKIILKILRKDGSEFFSRTFAKTDFSQYIDERSRKNDALLGVVFDRAEGNSLYFAASVGSPDIVGSDEYIPFIVKIAKDGSMSIAKDTHPDISGGGGGSPDDAEIDEGV